MITIVLNIIIIIASFTNLFAVIKDRKTNSKSIKLNIVIIVTSAILSICWFAQVPFVSQRIVPLAYIIAIMHIFMIIVEIEYFIDMKKAKDFVAKVDDKFIDIGKWDNNNETNNEENKDKENNTTKTIENKE